MTITQFKTDPKERAFVRSKLPPELIATIDNAEVKVNTKVDETIAEFKSNVQAKVQELTDRDFAGEMQEQLDAQQKELIDGLSEKSRDIKEKIDKINQALEQELLRNEDLKKLFDEMVTARTNLDSELQKTRERVAAIGSTAGKLAKSAVSKFLTGIF